MYRTKILLAALVLSVVLGGVAEAQISVAETLLVDLRADDLPVGQTPATWVNHGSLSNFTAQGEPLVEEIDGMRAVTFDGASYFVGPSSTSGIEGAGTRSIEVWAYNPALPAEETMLSWARRGGPEGSNMSFNYGNDTRWGAMGHWGGDTHDMGWWGSHAPAPAANTWWHLVYTYDGTGARIYVNGQLESTRNPIAINTHGGTPIRVAAQANTAGTGVDAAFNFTGSIAAVRIHDGVLSQTQIQNNFKLGRLRAYSPSPANGGTNPTFYANLSWKPGSTAQTQSVYFGEDYDAVLAGTGGTLRHTQSTAANWYLVGVQGYPYPTGLEFGKTYYWRIDSIEADGVTVHAGSVWSFTVPPKKAYGPSPADGSKFVDPDTELTWTTGYLAVTHTVYFSDDYDTVATASGGTGQGPTVYEPTGTLEYDTTYYWRVDEFDGSQTHTGDIWSFTTIPDIAVTDPNLLGWWTFDEGTGNTALDWSGNGNHGDIIGGTQWIAGYDGGALRLRGVDGYVNLPIGQTISTLESTTITTWVDFSNAGGAWQRIFDFGSGTGVYMFLCPRTGTGGPLRFAITNNGGGAAESLIDASTTLASGWRHVAVVLNGADSSAQIYLDGISVGNMATATNLADLGQTSQNWLGRSQYGADAYFNGSLDDFRIYDYAMTADQIPETMRGNPLLAWDPDPRNGSIVDVRYTMQLSWAPGDMASRHDVYFGTDQAAVENAGTESAEHMARQSGTTYPLAGMIEFGGGPYYWRIDEVNTDTTVSKGRVWSFSVADYFVIDDMEDYNNYAPDRVFETWIDGWGDNSNGSIIGYPEPDFEAGENFVETSIVHGGDQAMPYFYDSNMKYSEATMTLQAPNRDWTQDGVQALSLWYYGYPASQGGLVEGPAGIYTMTGAGGDIWNIDGVEADEFHFAWKTLQGSGSMTAKVSAISGANLNAWAKAGIMIRETLDPNSAHAFMATASTEGVAIQFRPSAAGASENYHQRADEDARPIWIRLERDFSGNFIASHANDVGGNPDKWTALNSPNIQMASTVYIGLALTSHQRYVPATATFSNITTTGNVTGATFTAQDIGITSNGPELMYVKIKDAQGRTATVQNTDPDAANVTSWTEWGRYGQGIALQEFIDKTPGLNLADVDAISIGFGTQGNTQPGGSGLVFFDDIRLYKSRCFPDLARPALDFSDNCVVDMPDLEILTDNWLMANWQITPVAPGNSGLVAHYRFENNAQDSSSQGHHGTPVNSPTYVAGQVGQAMLFNGSTQYVDLGTWDPSAPTGQLTVAVWARWNGLTSNYQGLVAKRDSWSSSNMMWQLETNISTGALGFFREGSGRYPGADDYAMPVGEWTHVAGTFDGTTGTIYINGSSTGSYPLALGSDTEAALVIGAVEANGGSPFNGALDDVRLYNRALSQAEVASLAGKTAAFDQDLSLLLRPIDANMDTNSDGVINFSDYAALIDAWLEQALWP